MFDGLLKSAFYTKCKSLIKMIKTRIEVIKRKRNATLKFLKRDIADLLASGHDTNAFGRAEGLLLELDVSFCYDFVETSCEFVKQHLSAMDKQRECPAECRESVSSLLSAAAGFSDLPELRELRQIFQERYGNSLDYFGNKEFVEKLASNSWTVDRKIQLLKDIASEFLITWDSRAFERRMSMPSAKGQPKTYGIVESADNKHKPGNRINSDVKAKKHNGPVRGRTDKTTYKQELSGGKDRNFSKGNEINLEPKLKLVGDDCKALNGQKASSLKQDGTGIPFQGKQQVSSKNEDSADRAVGSGCSSQGKKKDSFDIGYKVCFKRENIVPPNNIQDDQDDTPKYTELKSRSNHKETASYNNNYDAQSNMVNSVRKLKGEGINLKPYHNSPLPPPYVKPKIKLKDHKYGANIGPAPVGFECDEVLKGTSGTSSAVSSAASYMLGVDQLENPDHARQFVKSLTENDHGQEKNRHHQDELISALRPKPRSLRHKGVDAYDDEATRRPQSRRTKHSKHGPQQLNDDYNKIDEEESKLDRLLIHYSRKSSGYEPEMIIRNSRSRHSHQAGIGASELLHSRNKDESDEHLESVSFPVRSFSLPNEQAVPSEVKKVFDRAASMQPVRHVHPKLPNYDDLAAHFAALKGQ